MLYLLLFVNGVSVYCYFVVTNNDCNFCKFAIVVIES